MQKLISYSTSWFIRGVRFRFIVKPMGVSSKKRQNNRRLVRLANVNTLVHEMVPPIRLMAQVISGCSLLPRPFPETHVTTDCLCSGATVSS